MFAVSGWLEGLRSGGAILGTSPHHHISFPVQGGYCHVMSWCFQVLIRVFIFILSYCILCVPCLLFLHSMFSLEHAQFSLCVLVWLISSSPTAFNVGPVDHSWLSYLISCWFSAELSRHGLHGLLMCSCHWLHVLLMCSCHGLHVLLMCSCHRLHVLQCVHALASLLVFGLGLYLLLCLL